MAQKTGGGDYNAISDINVTPFVDVVLVLLVIFMVTAPTIMKDSLGVQLPKSSQGSGAAPKTFGVAITKQGQFIVNGEVLDDATFSTKVQEALKSDPGIQALISADADSRHVELVRAIDLLKSAGLEKFALEVRKENAPGDIQKQ
jgi:biopolymer transport protein ExbD